MNKQSTLRRNQEQFLVPGTKTKQDQPTTRSADTVYQHAIRAAPLSLQLHHINLVVWGVWQPLLAMIFKAVYLRLLVSHTWLAH